MRRELEEVITERRHQDEKWGEQNHDDGTWSLILAEEVGEASKAALGIRFTGDTTGRLEVELIQAAAVAVAWLESIRRRGKE